MALGPPRLRVAYCAAGKSTANRRRRAAPGRRRRSVSLRRRSLHHSINSLTPPSTSASLPPSPRRRIYTVLRSPHVNKDSREQFELRTHQRLVDVKNLTSQTVDRLMQLDLPAGVDIEVKL